MNSALTEIQRRTLAILESRIEQIALLPSIVAQIAALDIDSPTATDDIIKLIRSDPPLALRLMRLANSDYLGKGGVTTIPAAILQVGVDRVIQAILTLSIIEVFVPNTQGQRNLWIHSIQTALAARRLAALRPDLGVTPEESFLAGLLHDIGRFVIFEHRPEEMAQIDEADVADPRELVETEIRVCGFDHATLGSMVCDRWRLPETVIELVRTHHFYGDARRKVPPEVAILVRLVQEADCVSFGLLRHPVSSHRSESESNNRIEESLRILPLSERVLPAARLAEELVSIDTEARIAAALINIRYAS